SSWATYATGSAPPRNPIRYTFSACCASAPNGHPIAAPPRARMNSRRLIRSPRRRGRRQVITDLREQLARAVRLRDEGVTTRRACLLGFSGQSIRDGDNRDRTEHRVGLDPPRRLVAVYPE